MKYQPGEPRAIQWGSKVMRALKDHERVDQCEAEGMDYGRFFVHLNPGWKWADMEMFDHADMIEHSRSFGGAAEALREVKATIPCGCGRCK